MKNKFDYYDIVIINSNKKKLHKVNGRKGIIKGISQDENNPDIFAYAVDIIDNYGSVEEGWFIFEADLKPTGKKVNSENYKPVDTIKVPRQSKNRRR